jgi:hypothetical protein
MRTLAVTSPLLTRARSFLVKSMSLPETYSILPRPASHA